MNSDQTGKSSDQSTPGPGEGLASERALWARFVKDRDPAIREELVRRYLPFAKNLALRYRGASESFDDLLQVASLGLVNAIDRFDHVAAVVHGHAHRGRFRGETPRGTPVYNCAQMVVETAEGRPYALIEV